jgi:hypothetical protein
MKHFFLLVSLLTIFFYAGWSQTTEVVLKKNFNGLYFNSFTDTIRYQYKINLFYNPVWADSLIIKQSKVPEALVDVLKSSLGNHNLYLNIVDDYTWILSKNFPIQNSLSSTYFELPRARSNNNILSDQMIEDAYEDVTLHDYSNNVIEIGTPGGKINGKNVILSGSVKEEETGSPIIGASIYVDDLKSGTVSDISGDYVLNLPKGKHQITFKSMGRKDVKLQVMLHSNGSLNANLKEKLTQLKAVKVIAEKGQNVNGIQMGVERIDAKTIKQIPSILGESDIMKAALLLPGVQTVGENASGFNVRGGSTDQNLILINHTPVFNTSHLFGFFSAFNPDVIKDFKLYKSAIPANYGGRISSVFDIDTKNGNRQKFSGGGGISPVTAKFTFEGPIIKDKLSFIIGVRTTYSDWVMKKIDVASMRNSKASFSDFNAKLSYDINKKNSIDFAAYSSSDYFKLHSDTAFSYYTQNASISWKHVFNEKLNLRIYGIYSNYQYNISSSQDTSQAFKTEYQINYKEIKAEISHLISSSHKFLYGFNSILYNMQPGKINPIASSSIVKKELEAEKALESALFFQDEYEVNPDLLITLGLRYSIYTFLGPKTVFNYMEGLPRVTTNILDSIRYSNNRIVKYYGGPELRLALRYKLGRTNSIKIGYNRMRQYLNMLSNTTSISPSDTWKLCDSYIKPQVGDQYSLGYYQDLFSGLLEFSSELYYKKIFNTLEYKGGAQLLLNDKIETDVISAEGKAYGIELMAKKNAGKLNGWISYAFARTFIRSKGLFKDEIINNGDYFPANYDKPNNLNIVGNYKFSRRFSISSDLTYSTGRPITYPVSKYLYNNAELLNYSNRNEYRIPDYFRWDLSFNVEGNLKSHKLAQSYWSFSIYNVTGRSNIYSIYFVSSGKDVQGYKMSIINQPLYTVTYNFKF